MLKRVLKGFVSFSSALATVCVLALCSIAAPTMAQTMDLMKVQSVEFGQTEQTEWVRKRPKVEKKDSESNPILDWIRKRPKTG